MTDVSSPASVLDPEQMQRLAIGQHEDAFGVLGPHEIGSGQWEVRAFRPLATTLSLVRGAGTMPMTRVHPAGLFVAAVASSERPAYRLHVQTPYGEWTEADAYSFGPRLTPQDMHALERADRPWRVLGCHLCEHGGVAGAHFAVWAPNARRASVVGDFNGWDGRVHCMRHRFDGGLFDIFIPGVKSGDRYKFEMLGPDGQLLPGKADPFAFAAEHPPATASIVCEPPPPTLSAGWTQTRAKMAARDAPISIYECHLASWARVPEEGNRYLTYQELADRLIPYVKDLGFTHIELLPISEYPFDGSWGYQPVSLFAPTSRFGTPADFAGFVEAVHASGLGLILDWVPAHFPNDPHGLAEFDGTHLYEHADPRQGFHQDWGTYIYNFDRPEVAGFLVSNAQFWLERYEIDGFRVDAVASMLYLDYSRKHGEWVPNQFGGRENLGAIAFLQRANETAYGSSPGTMMVAEESTSWPGVSKPTYLGGLGFGYKWNMGWMHDTLHFMQNDPIYRSHHHHDMTFGLVYAFSENFVLPLSHDEVVHGKGSLITKMPGDRWQKFANLRAYFGFMWTHPGKKLLFMGCEFAQEAEWNHDKSLDWHLLDQPEHRGIQTLIRDLNHAYRGIGALHERDCDPSGFEWLVGEDRDNSVLVFSRTGNDGSYAVVACNFTPVPRENYRFGVARGGFYDERVNTDAGVYGGSNVGNLGDVAASDTPSHAYAHSLAITLPPLATVVLVQRS